MTERWAGKEDNEDGRNDAKKTNQAQSASELSELTATGNHCRDL